MYYFADASISNMLNRIFSDYFDIPVDIRWPAKHICENPKVNSIWVRTIGG